jgi:hypothetical protein
MKKQLCHFLYFCDTIEIKKFLQNFEKTLDFEILFSNL